MAKNPRISPKERGLLKGAINRVFSRSELRRRVIEKSVINHYDQKRPRVTKWVRCSVCNEPSAAYQCDVDHTYPRVPLDIAFEDMSLDDYVDRTWCEEKLLTPMCKTCHHTKSRLENKTRRDLKKIRKREMNE